MRYSFCTNSAPVAPAWQAEFLKLLPAITRHARIAFRHLDPEARDEAVQEVICNACCAYARLAARGKTQRAFPTVLARFAVAQVLTGRQVGARANVHEVLSPHAQRRKCFVVERLQRADETEEGNWCDILVEDRHATPAEIVCMRLDFAAWLALLPRRARRIAERLATGETVNGGRADQPAPPGTPSGLAGVPGRVGRR